MKNKHINKVVLLLLFFLSSYHLFSQISTDLVKYWFYRDRLNKYFVVTGKKKGESQIVGIRNSRTTDTYDNTGACKNIDYGQQGKYTGLYIGVLATEYYLLNNNGQITDANKTYNELFDALYAIKIYWDQQAEPFWSKDTSYNGFFIRGNVPCDFLNPSAPDGITINGDKHIDLLNNKLAINDNK